MPALILNGERSCFRDATDLESGIVDVRVTSTADERSVVIHVHVGRSRVFVQVSARRPAWVPHLQLPDALTLDEPDFAALARAARTAFRVWRRHFG